MENLTTFITSSQVKIFPDSPIMENLTHASILSNESISFTVAYKTESAEYFPVSISAEAEGAEISIYKIGYVPVTHGTCAEPQIAGENKGAGLYPDVLLKRNSHPEIIKGKQIAVPYREKDEKNRLNATGEFQSVLISVNENSRQLTPGDFTVKVRMTSLWDTSLFSEHTVKITVIGKSLPEADIYYTNWLHYDCISDIHHIPLYSDEYFELLAKYLKNAVMHGMNTLLIPVWTPPLDTLVGEERTNVQTVKISTKDGYKFDFSLLERLIVLATECGIKHFEHPHFFSQWGAEHAPNIYDEDGNLIFGWKTDATGEEYGMFLESYVAAFVEFAKNAKILDKVFFHISDEPTPENEETYKKAVGVVSSLIKDYPGGDALSSVRFYDEGVVKTPIVEISSADNFDGKCPSFWLYYTGGKIKSGSNRRITNKPYCTRILGLHLFRYKAAGFLHWGYNFCYDCMSMGIFNPASDPCGYKQMPGVSFLSYPGTNDCLPSLREKYMCEAINDYRALKLLESFIGYDNVMAICENFFGEKISSRTIPGSEEDMIRFRELINEHIRNL